MREIRPPIACFVLVGALCGHVRIAQACFSTPHGSVCDSWSIVLATPRAVFASEAFPVVVRSTVELDEGLRMQRFLGKGTFVAPNDLASQLMAVQPPWREEVETPWIQDDLDVIRFRVIETVAGVERYSEVYIVGQLVQRGHTLRSIDAVGRQAPGEPPSCYYFRYAYGQLYLLMLDSQGGLVRMNPGGSVNRQLSGPSDPWVEQVRTEVALGCPGAVRRRSLERGLTDR